MVQLNKEQQLAVDYLDGKSIIISGPGSGKTRVLTQKVVRLIKSGVNPSSIMLVTFTNKASSEMKSRVQSELGPVNIISGTFHHIANIFLNQVSKNPFKILNQEDKIGMIRNIINQNPYIPEQLKRFLIKAENVSEISSYLVNFGLSLEDTLEKRFSSRKKFAKIIQIVLNEYSSQKEMRMLLDFDDLLLIFLHALKDPTTEHLRSSIKYILVDEFQDVNNIQADIILEFMKTCSNLTCVGDDCQSIFGFQGSNINHILNLHTKFRDVKTFHLVQNYRSTPEIINLYNDLISYNKHQIKKEIVPTRELSGVIPSVCFFSNDNKEMMFIFNQIKRAFEGGIPFTDQAIICRLNRDIRILRNGLFRAGIHGVSLLSIHNSKGSEFDTVYIFNCRKGVIPHICAKDSYDIREEERRLLYVACSRAKNNLVITYSIGKNKKADCGSNFISDLDKQLYYKHTDLKK
jgi:DNA helicase II / ATP-dependent DNA helicase PcrA